MAIANAGHGFGNFSGASGSVTATVGTTPAVGALLVLWVWTSGSSANAITVSGLTFTQVGSSVAINGVGNTLALFQRIADGTEIGGTSTVTVTQSSGGTMQFWCEEYTGVLSPVTTDGTNSHSNGSTGTSCVTGTVTTTDPGDLVIVGAGITGSAGGTFSFASATMRTPNSSPKLFGGDYLPGTTLSGFQDTFSWTTSRIGSAIIATFKPAATAISGADTGAGADAGETVSVAETAADTGAGADAEAVSIAESDADTGAGADAGELVTVGVSEADVGTGDEVADVTVTIADDETGAAVDVATSPDTGTQIADADIGTDAEAGTVVTFTADDDDGTGADAEAVAATATDTDAGTGDDQAVVADATAATETGASAEGIGIVVLGPGQAAVWLVGIIPL